MDGRSLNWGVNPLRQALAQFTLFLPLLILSALALGSFMLYQTSAGDDEQTPLAKLGIAPDYYVERFAARQYDAKGQLKSEIFGQKAVHLPASSQIEIQQVRMNSTSDQGRRLNASATRALTTDDRSRVQLTGNAQARLTAHPNAPVQDPVEFSSEQLLVLSQAKALVSEVPVKVSQGKNTFSSSSMHYDHAAQVLSLKGNVRVTLFPRNPS